MVAKKILSLQPLKDGMKVLKNSQKMIVVHLKAGHPQKVAMSTSFSVEDAIGPLR